MIFITASYLTISFQKGYTVNIFSYHLTASTSTAVWVKAFLDFQKIRS